MVQFYVNRFARKIKKEYYGTVHSLPGFKIRNKVGAFLVLKFGTKSLYHRSVDKAATTLFQAFEELGPSMHANRVMIQSDKYLSSIKKIQKWWTAKYRARFHIL